MGVGVLASTEPPFDVMAFVRRAIYVRVAFVADSRRPGAGGMILSARETRSNRQIYEWGVHTGKLVGLVDWRLSFVGTHRAINIPRLRGGNMKKWKVYDISPLSPFLKIGRKYFARMMVDSTWG